MIEDAELLREYANSRSEAAFAELVHRHLALVYSVAVRQCRGDTHRAQDVVQSVFTDLSAKAGRLSRHPVLSGWLHRSAQLAALNAVREDHRRRLREQKAQTMHALTSDPAPDFEAVRPILDEVIGELDELDRDAVALRFFENRPFADIGAKLRLTENAARMKVERALDKLQGLLARRGITSSSTALAGALAHQAGLAAPAGLAASVVNTAVAATASTATGTILVPLLTMAKFPTATVAVLALVGAGLLLFQGSSNAALARDVEALRRDNRELIRIQGENRRLTQIAAEVASYRDDDRALQSLQAQATEFAQRAKDGTGPREVSGPVYSASEVEVQPRPTMQSSPKFPAELKAAGQGGEALIRFVVDAAGTPREAMVLRATHPEFGEAAAEALKNWAFAPGKLAGKSVNVRMDLPIVFRLSTGGSPPPPSTAVLPGALPNWFPTP